MLNRILIDPQAFAAKGETLNGSVALNDLDERVWSPDIAAPQSVLHYALHGGTDKWQRPFLELSVSGDLPLHCQRCMQAVKFTLDEQVRITLFDNEENLDEAMLADEELEGMLLEPELDVLTLVEDQILMALPISPKHEHCDNADLTAANQNKPNPFAVLAGLKKG